jgi:hypothetical protein
LAANSREICVCFSALSSEIGTLFIHHAGRIARTALAGFSIGQRAFTMRWKRRRRDLATSRLAKNRAGWALVSMGNLEIQAR